MDMKFIKAVGIAIIGIGAVLTVLGVVNGRGIFWILNVASLIVLGAMIVVIGNVKKWLE